MSSIFIFTSDPILILLASVGTRAHTEAVVTPSLHRLQMLCTQKKRASPAIIHAMSRHSRWLNIVSNFSVSTHMPLSRPSPDAPSVLLTLVC